MRPRTHNCDQRWVHTYARAHTHIHMILQHPFCGVKRCSFRNVETDIACGMCGPGRVRSLRLRAPQSFLLPGGRRRKGRARLTRLLFSADRNFCVLLLVLFFALCAPCDICDICDICSLCDSCDICALCDICDICDARAFCDHCGPMWLLCSVCGLWLL